MKKSKKIVSTVTILCLSVFMTNVCSAVQKILSVDVQKVFENYADAKVAHTAFEADATKADQELKEMYDSAMKLQEEIASLNEKAENTALLESAREKFKAEADEKLETLRIKEGEFLQLRQDVNKQFADRRNKEISGQGKAIEAATAKIAKSKKADIVLNKVPGTLYVDETLDITQLVIDELNAKKK